MLITNIKQKDMPKFKDINLKTLNMKFKDIDIKELKIFMLL